MPSLELSALSSNWKILQQRLKAGKSTAEPAVAPHRSNKRKRTDAAHEKHSNGVDGRAPRLKRKRLDHVSTTKPSATELRPRKRTAMTMGTSVSSEAADPASDTEPPLAALSTPAPTTITTSRIGKYIGLDCEMVGTGPAPSTTSILARASLVNFHGEILYDAYVLPPPGIEVTDYRTHVSGIRPTDLIRNGPRFPKEFTTVQKEVADLLDGRILVGHAIRNDLKVLMLGHSARDIRDTARYGGFRKVSGTQSPALRVLSELVLGVRIQSGEHSSVEDARAAMSLFRREKDGFEREVKALYGKGPVVQKKKGVEEVRQGKSKVKALAAEDDVDESEEQADTDADEVKDGGEEEGDGDGDGEDASAPPNKKKKKKKKKKQKKRTQRA